METKNSFYEEYRKRIETLTEEDIFVFNHIDEMPDQGVKCESFVCMLCLEGKASCSIGDLHGELRKNDLFLGQPNMFLENTMVSLDFEFLGVLLSPAFMESIMLLSGIGTSRFASFENPVVHLEDSDVELCKADFNFLQTKLSGPRSKHFRDSSKLLVQSMVFEIYDRIEPLLQELPHTYSSPEILYQRFMDLATRETPRQREVKYYAERLCITPKYLSAICKQTSGQTASAILNQLTTDFIRRTLRTTNKSVKEIAHEAGFDNISFFGKYVRRELGTSPRAFRLQK